MSNKLEQKVSNALAANGHQTAADIAGLLTELEQAIVTAEEAAKAAHEASLDPAKTPDPVAARHASENAAFRANRLKTLLPRLQQRYTAAVTREEAAAGRQKAAPILAQRDQIAAEFVQIYGECAAAIAELFQRAAANNTELNRLCQSLPANLGLDLREAELVGRNLGQFTRDRPSVISGCVLMNYDGRTLWPERRLPDPVMFEPVPHNRRFSPEWGMVMDEENAAAEAKAIEAQKQREQAAADMARELNMPEWWRK
jgi:hypothetical protein